VAWRRPTAVLSVSAGTPRNTSDEQYGVYAWLAARDGYAWKQMAEKAKINPAELGSLGIAGFSAFHGFANGFLKNPVDAARCCYVHLADACFLGAGATKPHEGYAKFATEAALGKGDKLMVATTNGPWGKPLEYSYDYGDPSGPVHFSLTSGAQCFELTWNAAMAAVGGKPSKPEVPPGLPEPSRSFRVGNLIWLHYETMTKGLPNPCKGEYTLHGWHVSALATPLMQYYGAPWMAGERGGALSAPGGSTAKLVVAGAAAVFAYALVRLVLRPWRGQP
jgi:hypothetical protein